MLFSNPLIEVSPLELMKLWGELVEAYHGVNGFGGNTAEIYAYRFMAYSPVAHSSITPESRLSTTERDTLYYKAANQLIALIEEFINCYDGCQVMIDGEPYAEWLRLVSNKRIKFDHRVHVAVEKKERIVKNE